MSDTQMNTSPAAAGEGPPELQHAAPSWQVKTAGGLDVHVPDRLASITTYVLLEQEQWFEAEFAFVERLVEPSSWVLDIGANHGIYALALAQRLDEGHVIAFEPTHEPRSRLLRSILDNRLAARISVAPLGLSDSRREVSFNTGHDSELNSLHGGGGRSETVTLDTLDRFLQRHAAGRSFDFVKLDAEGEEPAVLRGGDAFFRSQSPVVMFELMHGSKLNHGLVEQFEALGYGIYRHLPGLDLLAPWRADSAASDVPLNLFAIKPGRACALAGRGLLASERISDPELAPTLEVSGSDIDAARHWLAQQRAFALSDLPLPSDATDAQVLDLLLAAHVVPGLGASQRLSAARQALALLSHQLPQGGEDAPLPPLHRVAMAVHALHVVGLQKAAVSLASQALYFWPRDAVLASVYLPPALADLQRPCSSTPAEWLRLVLAEYVECHRAFSSYFAPGDPLQLRRLLRHPDHSAEIERRYALGEFRQNRVPDRQLLPQLRAGEGSVNPGLWSAVLAELE
jgi:protein O-GlcNAc transferase